MACVQRRHLDVRQRVAASGRRVTTLGRVCPAVYELLVCLIPECEEVFFSVASPEARGIQGFKF
jgi:hypothetical protein